MEEDRVPLDYPAPNRASVELPNGKWGTREWEEGEKAWYQKTHLTKPATKQISE